MTDEKDNPKPKPEKQDEEPAPRPAPVVPGEKKTFKQRGVEKRG